MCIKEVNQEVNLHKRTLQILKVCRWSNPYVFIVLATVGTIRRRLTQWHTTHTSIVLQFHNTLTRCYHYPLLFVHIYMHCLLLDFLLVHHFLVFIRYLVLQVFAAVAVSTGCLSYGICMAYTSSAIPSMMEPDSALNISDNEASWMSKLFCNSQIFILLVHLMLLLWCNSKCPLSVHCFT